MKTDLEIEKCSLLTGDPLLIAGPCSAESETQLLATAKAIAEIKQNTLFRAGIWKPRTRPGAFEGMGEIALEWMRTVKQETGMKTATEVANARHVELCLGSGIDVLWIGARTTVNPFSVQEIADALSGVDVPVLVKNPVSPDLQLWLGAFERLNKRGINKIAAIHRGFHSYDTTPFRNDPKWEMVIQLKTLCPQIPVICDPSHICGSTELIPYIAQKALDMDMNGLMIETHCLPEVALSDAKQQLNPAQLKKLLGKLVIRTPRSADTAYNNKLEELREDINHADEGLLRLLMSRMKIAEEIGLYKHRNNVTILQADRWEGLLKDRIDTAEMMGLTEEFVRALYQLIHEESIRKQESVMNK
ncbi:MAG: chorismate mutase [Bacteroidia bacterium]